jgi:hypothetical protein
VISDNSHNYSLIPATPATGILYITQSSPHFISGHIRMRGRNGGQYPFNYLEMIEGLFGSENNTIEVCSGDLKDNCFKVDINPETKPDLVADGQTLECISDCKFNRWRCDPPYNSLTAREMYGTDLPLTSKLLKAGARVCKPGSLMFLLLGPKNYQICPIGVKRLGWIAITVVPNNELRTLHIFYKYSDSVSTFIK